jgi:superfamily II DNA/RNA helicase
MKLHCKEMIFHILPQIDAMICFDGGRWDAIFHRLGRVGRMGNKGEAILMWSFGPGYADTAEEWRERKDFCRHLGSIGKADVIPDWWWEYGFAPQDASYSGW